MSDLNPSPDFEEKVRKAMQTPNAKPEFANRLRNELVRRPVKMKTNYFRPVWAVAFMLALAVLVVSVPSLAAALGRVFGYVPEVGLVETTNGLRMLAEPVSSTRDGITITITNVLVYDDHIELMYEVDGVQPNYNNTPDMCGTIRPDNNFWSDSDADLRLPDGTTIRRDYAGEYQFANRYSMQPVYAIHLPADVHELTFVLKCIPFTKLGNVPENWEILFKLVTVPAGEVVGYPVIEVTQPVTAEEVPIFPSAEVAPAPKVTMTLERIIPTDANTVIYFHLNMENADPSLISIMPQNAYVIDSLGQQISLRGGFIWQPFEYKVGSAFEFVTESKPSAGPLTVVVDRVIAYYMPLYTDPPHAKVEDMQFTFDVGENPQYGQTWDLNKIFTIAGYEFEIATARTVTFSDIATPNYIDGSQGYDYGYQFVVEADPSFGLSIEMDIRADGCWLTDVKKIEPSPLLYTQLCRDGYPKGILLVTIREVSVVMDDDLQVEWIP
jgi:hypothetical protein